MPCPFATEMARSLERLKHAHKRAVAAAKVKVGIAQADRALFRCQRMYEAAKRAAEDAQRRNPKRLEAAE